MYFRRIKGIESSFDLGYNINTYYVGYYMFGYIYKTTNLINGKIYIGQHKSETFDTKYYGSGKLFRKAFKKYGELNFTCELIEECNDSKTLDNREIYWISYYRNLGFDMYNISDGGFNPRLSGINHPLYGKHHTEASKLKNSESHKGKIQSNETKQKRVLTRRETMKRLKREKEQQWILEKHKCAYCGKIMTYKHTKGVYCSYECSKQSRINKNANRIVTLETRHKMSLAGKGKEGYWKGKERDSTTKLKVSKSLSNKPRPYRYKPFYIGDVYFNCMQEAAEYYGVTKACINVWIRNGITSKGELVARVNKNLKEVF